MSEQEDQFQFWLMDMDDALERFLSAAPNEFSNKLDFTAESLKDVEAFILQYYPSIDDIKNANEAKTVDALARYVGETFRKNLGGKWFIDFKDKKNAFYGLPQLKEMRGQTVQICPITLVSASTDRRTGSFIYSVFQNIETKSSK